MDRSASDVYGIRPRGRGLRRWLGSETLAVAFSIVALLVSAFTLLDEQRFHREAELGRLADELHEDYVALALATDWEVAHLVEPPGRYDETRDRLRAYAAKLPAPDRTRIHFLERTSAIRMVSAFEHLWTQYRAARGAGDEARAAVLATELELFTGGYLRNPRLLWYLAPEGGGLLGSLEPDARAYYRSAVLENPAAPLESTPDPVGLRLDDSAAGGQP